MRDHALVRAIDKDGGCTLCSRVLSVRRLATILLVAVWLPAVLHCRVESLIGLDCCASTQTDHSEKKGCEGDICDTLEAGFVKSSSGHIAIIAPLLSACLIFCDWVMAPAELSEPLVTGIIEEAMAPPEIIQSRHFLARSALPARDSDCSS